MIYWAQPRGSVLCTATSPLSTPTALHPLRGLGERASEGVEEGVGVSRHQCRGLGAHVKE